MGSLLIILIILRMNKEKVNIFHISLMSIILKLKIIIPTMSGHDHSGFTIPIVGHLRTQMTKYHSLFIENLSTNFQRGLRIRVFFNFILSLLRVITLILNPVLFMRALKVTHFRQLDDPLTVFGLGGTIFGSVFTLSA